MTGSQTYRPAYRPTPTSWQPPRPRCECNQLRCRLARAEAERDELARIAAELIAMHVDVRRDLMVAST